jgi:hypothetical protein
MMVCRVRLDFHKMSNVIHKITPTHGRSYFCNGQDLFLIKICSDNYLVFIKA